MTQIVTRLFDTFSDAQHAVIELERVGVPHGDISLVSHKDDTTQGDSVRREPQGAHLREPHDTTAPEAGARDAGVGAAAGGAIGAAGGVLAGLGLIAIPGLGPVVAAGWLAAAAVGAVTGAVVAGAAGGLVGALTHAGVSQQEADFYAEAVRRGGTLVSAQVPDDKVAAAELALKETPYVDVAARRDAYRASGWTGFDPAAAPYSVDDIERERTLYVR